MGREFAGILRLSGSGLDSLAGSGQRPSVAAPGYTETFSLAGAWHRQALGTRGAQQQAAVPVSDRERLAGLSQLVSQFGFTGSSTRP